jgi:hypothetical protein
MSGRERGPVRSASRLVAAGSSRVIRSAGPAAAGIGYNETVHMILRASWGSRSRTGLGAGAGAGAGAAIDGAGPGRLEDR